jgi:hypothetical protein
MGFDDEYRYSPEDYDDSQDVDSNSIDSYELVYQHETEKGFCVREKGCSDDIWLPKSRIVLPKNYEIGDVRIGESLEVGIPLWLAKDKGLA